MPILSPEPDRHPDDLFPDAGWVTDDSDDSDTNPNDRPLPPSLFSLADRPWHLAYTKRQQEKKLLRSLRGADVWHYCPIVPHRQRSPAGRIRVSHKPLFAGYAFVCGDEPARLAAFASDAVVKLQPVEDTEGLIRDLAQIADLLRREIPMTIETTIQPGDRVRIKTGAFAGYEGQVLQRRQRRLLYVTVSMMNQGIGVELDDCQIEKL